MEGAVQEGTEGEEHGPGSSELNNYLERFGVLATLTTAIKSLLEGDGSKRAPPYNCYPWLVKTLLQRSARHQIAETASIASLRTYLDRQLPLTPVKSLEGSMTTEQGFVGSNTLCHGQALPCVYGLKIPVLFTDPAAIAASRCVHNAIDKTIKDMLADGRSVKSSKSSMEGWSLSFTTETLLGRMLGSSASCMTHLRLDCVFGDASAMASAASKLVVRLAKRIAAGGYDCEQGRGLSLLHVAIGSAPLASDSPTSNTSIWTEASLAMMGDACETALADVFSRQVHAVVSRAQQPTGPETTDIGDRSSLRCFLVGWTPVAAVDVLSTSTPLIHFWSLECCMSILYGNDAPHRAGTIPIIGDGPVGALATCVFLSEEHARTCYGFCSALGEPDALERAVEYNLRHSVSDMVEARPCIAQLAAASLLQSATSSRARDLAPLVSTPYTALRSDAVGLQLLQEHASFMLYAVESLCDQQLPRDDTRVLSVAASAEQFVSSLRLVLQTSTMHELQGLEDTIVRIEPEHWPSTTDWRTLSSTLSRDLDSIMLAVTPAVWRALGLTIAYEPDRWPQEIAMLISDNGDSLCSSALAPIQHPAMSSSFIRAVLGASSTHVFVDMDDSYTASRLPHDVRGECLRIQYCTMSELDQAISNALFAFGIRDAWPDDPFAHFVKAFQPQLWRREVQLIKDRLTSTDGLRAPETTQIHQTSLYGVTDADAFGTWPALRFCSRGQMARLSLICLGLRSRQPGRLPRHMTCSLSFSLSGLATAVKLAPLAPEITMNERMMLSCKDYEEAISACAKHWTDHVLALAQGAERSVVKVFDEEQAALASKVSQVSVKDCLFVNATMMGVAWSVEDLVEAAHDFQATLTHCLRERNSCVLRLMLNVDGSSIPLCKRLSFQFVSVSPDAAVGDSGAAEGVLRKSSTLSQSQARQSSPQRRGPRQATVGPLEAFTEVFSSAHEARQVLDDIVKYSGVEQTARASALRAARRQFGSIQPTVRFFNVLADRLRLTKEPAIIEAVAVLARSPVYLACYVAFRARLCQDLLLSLSQRQTVNDHLVSWVRRALALALEVSVEALSVVRCQPCLYPPIFIDLFRRVVAALETVEKTNIEDVDAETVVDQLGWIAHVLEHSASSLFPIIDAQLDNRVSSFVEEERQRQAAIDRQARDRRQARERHSKPASAASVRPQDGTAGQASAPPARLERAKQLSSSVKRQGGREPTPGYRPHLLSTSRRILPDQLGEAGPVRWRLLDEATTTSEPSESA